MPTFRQLGAVLLALALLPFYIALGIWLVSTAELKKYRDKRRAKLLI